MVIKVKVRINKKTPAVHQSEEGFIVDLKSKPIDNEANLELISLISKYFEVNKRHISIIAGKTSRNKLIKIEGE